MIDTTIVLNGVAEASARILEYTDLSEFRTHFRQLDANMAMMEMSYTGPVVGSRKKEASRRPPPWFVGMASAFVKMVEGVDKKLKGRILEAVADILANPLESHGDTKKQLTGDLADCWRYRIGNYRLVYRPDKELGNITLIAFGARGGIYD